MSLNITGNQANITTPLTANVTAIASGAGGVWLVTTSAPHLFGNGDYVELQVMISAVAVVAFGFVTIIDSTHFSVAGTTFTATGTGSATDLSLTPQILVPTDGDPLSLQLSGLLSALQGLADRTQFLRYQMLPKIGVVAPTNGAQFNAVTVTNTGSLLDTTVFIDIAGIDVGDVLTVSGFMWWYSTSNNDVFEVAVYEDHTGANVLKPLVSFTYPSQSTNSSAPFLQPIIGNYTASYAGTGRIMVRCNGVNTEVSHLLYAQLAAVRFSNT